MVNRVILLGRVGDAPVLRQTGNGTDVANFSLATNKRKKDGEETQWHRIVTFGKTAANCAKYVTKGMPVFIEGEIQTRSYDKDGQTRYITEILANNVQFLGRGEVQSPQTEEDIPY